MIESDAELVARVRRGNLDAFESLVRRYERSVRSVATAYLYDAHSAEDVAQETFVAAYGSLGRLRDPAKFGPWLMRIARRVSGKALDARRRSPATVPFDDAPSSSSTPSDHPRSSRLLSSIEKLPENERLVVAMRYFDGHTTQEIADATGRPLGTVTKQLSRAYERLRTMLAEPEESSHERT